MKINDELSLEFIEAIKDAGAIFITENKKMYTTSRVKECFSLCDEDFLYGG